MNILTSKKRLSIAFEQGSIEQKGSTYIYFPHKLAVKTYVFLLELSVLNMGICCIFSDFLRLGLSNLLIFARQTMAVS